MRWLLITCVLAAASAARAQSTQAAATSQFDQGRAFMKQKKYAEACDAFAKSQKLDPQNGTLFNLADCSTHLGKLATAWLAYRDVGQRDTNAARKQEANRRAKDLEKRMPKLLVRIESAPPGLAVTINKVDSTQLVGIESPVDLDDYQIRATAPGYEPFETEVAVADERKTVIVDLELEKTGTAPKPKKSKAVHARVAPPEEEPSTPTSHRRRNGVIAGVVGGGFVATGLVFGLRARSRWNDAEALCPDHTCPSTDDKQAGDALVDSANTSAAVSTAFVLGGAVVAGIGIYYAVTAKPAKTTAMIAPTPGGATFVLGGRF